MKKILATAIFAALFIADWQAKPANATTETLYGCFPNDGGRVRIVESLDECRDTENPITWEFPDTAAMQEQIDNLNSRLGLLEILLLTPVVDLNGPTRGGIDWAIDYTQGVVPQQLAPRATLTETYDLGLESLFIELQNPLDGLDETLLVDTTNTNIEIDPIFNGIGGSLLLNGRDSIVNYANVLLSVQYQNTSPAPTIGDRTFHVTSTVEGVSSETAIATVRVIQAQLVFLTSQSYMGGDLNGVTGADQICQNLADTNELAGQYVAFISDGNPDNNFHNRLGTTQRPYYLVDGRSARMERTFDPSPMPAFDTQQFFGLPINITEEGAELLTDERVWTGGFGVTIPRTTSHCSGWTTSSNFDTGRSGIVNGSFGLRVDHASVQCDRSYRLYCVEKYAGP